MAITPANHILCFGGMFRRLSALGNGHLFQIPVFEAHFGKAEANVALAQARIGLPRALLTILPGNTIDAGLVQAATAGLSLAALNHCTPGDQSLPTARDLATFDAGAADVPR